MSDTGNTTVLIVDDEEELVDLYATFLTPEYDVRTATGGSEAMSEIGPEVDVALLDRRMPHMSGDDVLAEMRDRGFECQVAMLTAVEPAADIVEMPFDDYQVKPVDRGDVVRLVEDLVERAAYDERSRAYFSLVSKKAALEIAGNDDSEEYEELLDRIEAVRGDLDETLDHIGVENAFKQISSD
jgi:DNA-binding NtrC family response regulator